MSAFQTFGSNQPSISSANVLFLGNQFNILILLASWQMFAVPKLVIATRAHMNLPRNYYEVLDVPRSADQKQIKKAFHKLALKYHPDKNKEPGAEERFREITQAYDTLSNKAKRKQYDQLGGEHGQPQKQQTFQQGNVKDLFDSFNFDDMFNKFHEKYDKSHHQSNDHFSFGFSNFFDNANLRQQKAASDEQNELFGKFPFLMIKNMFNIAADFVNGRREQKKMNCRRVTKQIQDTIISNIVCD